MAHPPTAPEVWEAFLDMVAEGKNSVAAISRMPGMPGLRTIYDEIDRNPEFEKSFKNRRAIGVRALFDDCLEIADEKPAGDLGLKHQRLRIDTRVRLAGKWLAAEFGERFDPRAATSPEENQIVIRGGLPDGPPPPPADPPE